MMRSFDDRQSIYTEPRFALSALVTIDTQRDVLDGGALEIPGTSMALGPICALARAFREAGLPIVHVVRLYKPDGSNVDLCRRQAVQDGAKMLAVDSDGSQLAEALLPDPRVKLDAEMLLSGRPQRLGDDEYVFYKPRWGAFYRTSLEEHLRQRAVTTLVFAGCNFPNCPRTSIYEASERDFRIVVARDALSGLDDRGEQELAAIGVLTKSTPEIAAKLANLQATSRA